MKYLLQYKFIKRINCLLNIEFLKPLNIFKIFYLF